MVSWDGGNWLVVRDWEGLDGGDWCGERVSG